MIYIIISLHYPINNNDTPHSTSSSLFLIGPVQLATIHEWIQSIFPEVPPRMDENSMSQVYFFRNTFTTATCIVEFRKNEVYESD